MTAVTMRTPFAPEQIGRLPKGGTFLDYVGHADITARLLDVDPDWVWEPFAVDDRGLPALDADGNLWIRLTVLGVTRIGVGDGASMKIRVGDALRNAAMRFGAALELWAKGDRQYGEQHGEAERPANADALDGLRAACALHGLVPAEVSKEFFETYGVAAKDADPSQLEQFTSWLTDRAAA